MAKITQINFGEMENLPQHQRRPRARREFGEIRAPGGQTFF